MTRRPFRVFDGLLDGDRTKAHAPQCRVIVTAYEMKRLGRDAAELTAHGLALEPELESIFTALAARWESSGRAVPGRPDEEWTILARRCPWPVG